jgi:hypothetical protein
VGPRAGLDMCEKSRLHRDSIPGPSRQRLEKCLKIGQDNLRADPFQFFMHVICTFDFSQPLELTFRAETNETKNVNMARYQN